MINACLCPAGSQPAVQSPPGPCVSYHAWGRGMSRTAAWRVSSPVRAATRSADAGLPTRFNLSGIVRQGERFQVGGRSPAWRSHPGVPGAQNHYALGMHVSRSGGRAPSHARPGVPPSLVCDMRRGSQLASRVGASPGAPGRRAGDSLFGGGPASAAASSQPPPERDSGGGPARFTAGLSFVHAVPPAQMPMYFITSQSFFLMDLA